jgi:hypothetical protein
LRIDYKYNPMAHDAKLHIETICISNLEIWKVVNPIALAGIVLTYPNWWATRIHLFPRIFFMACKMYYPFLNLISPCILTRASTRCILSKFTSLGSVFGTSWPMIALWVICIGDR